MDDDIAIGEYLALLWRNRRVIVLLLVLFAVLSGVRSMRTPTTYRAEATLIPISAEGGALAALSSVLPFAAGGGDMGMTDYKAMTILKSRRLAAQVANDLDVVSYLDGHLPDTPGMTVQDKRERAIGLVQSSLAVGREEGGIITVSAIWTDPEWAARIANGYVTALGVFLNSHSLNFNFQVVDPALPPRTKYGPPTKMNILYGGGLGALVGILLSVLLEYFRGRKGKPVL